MTGIEKLESFVKEKQYNEATNAIAASNDIRNILKNIDMLHQLILYIKKKMPYVILFLIQYVKN